MIAQRRFVPVGLVAIVILAIACEQEFKRDTLTTQSEMAVAPAPTPPMADAASPALRGQDRPNGNTAGAIGSGFGTGIASRSRVAKPGRPGSRTETFAASEEESNLQQPGSRAATETTSVASSAMLIRTGSATIEVDSLDRAIAAVQDIARQLGGYVANTNLMVGDRQVRQAALELRFPSSRFDQATNALRPLGKVESLVVSTEDVGEEFVDMTARMNNARRLEERLIDLLARRTGKLEDMLAVERELARVREEIERYEGRLRYLRSRTAMSTLTITVHEPAPVFTPRPGPSVIGEAFRDAWRNFVGFLAALIASLGWLVPLVAIVGGLIWAGRRWLPRRPAPAPAPSPSPRPTPLPEKRDAA